MLLIPVAYIKCLGNKFYLVSVKGKTYMSEAIFFLIFGIPILFINTFQSSLRLIKYNLTDEKNLVLRHELE